MTEQDFWNHRAQHYDAQVASLYRDAYCKTAKYALNYLSATDNVLEFACGTGIVTTQIAPHVTHIQAIDIAEEMVQRASQKIRSANMTNVDVVRMDLFDPTLKPEHFDAVMAFNVLCYVEPFEKTMARIHALLKPGGMFLSATDCLGEQLTLAGAKKWIKSRTGAMPYVGFFRMETLEKRITQCGFQILYKENLFPAPPNLFLAAKKQ